MTWFPDAKNLERERARWLRKHYRTGSPPVVVAGPLSDFLPEVTAGWISNELLPRLQMLQEQGYDLMDAQAVAELLENQADYQEAQYVRETTPDEWGSFIEMTALAGNLVKDPEPARTLAREVVRRAEANGLNVASIWESEDGQQGKVEFNEQPDRVLNFAMMVRSAFPGTVVKIEGGRYNVPMMWLSTTGEPNPTREAATGGHVMMGPVERLMNELGAGELDPRHVLSWIMVGKENDLGGGAVSDMTTAELRREVELGIEITRQSPDESESLARSYGL